MLSASARGDVGLRNVSVGTPGSGGATFVSVMKPADLRDRHNATIARRGDRTRDRRVRFAKNVRHVCDGGRRRRTMYFATVA